MHLPFPEKVKLENPCAQDDGVYLCQQLYRVLQPKGFFPALTGGLLYKEGLRKDIDIVIYRHRQKIDAFETKDLADVLLEAGVEITNYFGFVTKAKWKGYSVDIFNPETKDTELEDIYN